MRIRKKSIKRTPLQSELMEELFANVVETDEERQERERRIEQERIVGEVRRARKALAAMCREDVNEFIMFVGKDSESGEALIQNQIHEDLQNYCDTYKRLIYMSYPESGKSVGVILRVLWVLGNNPEKRIVFLSKNESNASKSTRLVKQYIEKSEELAEVFPELLPGEKWSESSFIVRRSHFSKDPSVQAMGIDGSPTGFRIDVLVIDDVLDLENTISATERKSVLRKIRGKFIDRLSKDAVVIFLTNAWHPEDAAHVLEKESNQGTGQWKVVRVPVYDDNHKLSWKEKWDWDRINEARSDMGPLEFARAFLCRARDEGESPFDKDAIEAAVDRANEFELDLVYAVRAEDYPNYAIYHGVDLASSKKSGSHLSSITTVALDLDTLERQLLWQESGRWSSGEIRNRIIDHEKRYGGTFIVENNNSQTWIIDIVYNQSDLPPEERVLPTIVPFTTGKQKAHPEFGVEGLAVEITNCFWLFPSTGPAEVVREVLELRGEMLYYVRGSHTGDRLMSLWFSREGCRRGALAGKPEKEGSESIADRKRAGGILGAGIRVTAFGEDGVE